MCKLKDYFGTFTFYMQALTIAVPVMVQLFVQSFVYLIDNFMVADLGNIKMSGVNVANQIVFVYMTAINTLGTAGGIFMSQYNGAKDKDGMRQSYRFKQLSMFLITVILIAVSLFIPELLLSLLLQKNVDKVLIVAEGKIYLSIIVFTFIPMSMSAAIASSLREIGLVKPPMYISITGACINTILNYILIYGRFGMPRMETAGAAYATVAARLMETALFFAYVKKISPAFYVEFKDIFKVKFSVFKTILKKSGWIFAADMSWAFSEMTATAVYNGRGGAEVVAGMAAGWTLANLFFLVFPAIYTSVSVIVGSTLGKNELIQAKDNAKKLRMGSVFLGAVVGAAAACSVFIIPFVFANLSYDAQQVTKKLVLIIALYMPVWTYQTSQQATASAGGETSIGMKLGMVDLFIFTPSMVLAGMFTSLDAPSMYGLVKVTSLLKAIIANSLLKKERWVKNLTLNG